MYHSAHSARGCVVVVGMRYPHYTTEDKTEQQVAQKAQHLELRYSLAQYCASQFSSIN